MDQFEKVEKIAQKANVSFSDAKQALEANNWDMLDAMMALEEQGKSSSGEQTNFSTSVDAQVGYKTVTVDNKVYTRKGIHEQSKKECKIVKTKFVDFLKKINDNHVVIRKDTKVILSLPIWLAVVFVLATWRLSIFLMIVSLLFGCRYTFEGPDIAASSEVNKTMSKVSDTVCKTADTIKESVSEGFKTECERREAKKAEEQEAQNSVMSATFEYEEKKAEEAHEAPVMSGSEFEKADFSGVTESFSDKSVTTEDGKITLEL